MFKKNNTFCINLNRRPDRLKSFINEINRIGGEFTRCTAVDGKELEPVGSLTKEQLGALESHLSVWKHALTLNLNEVVIFEDDCVFVDDFLIRFESFMNEVPLEWQFVKLGLYPCPEINYMNPISLNVGVINSSCWGAHAYMLKRGAIEFLVNSFNYNNAIDYISVPFPIFCPIKNLCLQSGSIGDTPVSNQCEYFRKITEERVKHSNNIDSTLLQTISNRFIS